MTLHRDPSMGREKSINFEIYFHILGQMIEDQVLFHLTKFGKIILSLLTFPDPLKGRDEAVPQGLRSASLNPVATQYII